MKAIITTITITTTTPTHTPALKISPITEQPVIVTENNKRKEIIAYNPVGFNFNLLFI
jgi:hypothetical protein